MGAVGVTGKGSWQCWRCGVPESPHPRPCPPSPGSRRSPAAGPLPEAVAVGNKEPARPPLPGPWDPEPGRAARGERERGHESSLVAVRAGFRSAGAGGEASACLLVARGTRGAGVPAPPAAPRKEASRPTPPVAPGLQLQGTDAQPWLPNPGYSSAGLREDPALPPGVLKLCVK